MLALLSPSKTLDFESPLATKIHTQPEFLADSAVLIKQLRNYSEKKLSELMDISDKLAALNHQRYRDFKTPFTPANARPAMLAFKGDVYEGIEVEHYQKTDFDFAQKHLRILSGLYGLLRPLDLIQPYRLEMGIALKNPRGKDLYQFWGERLTAAINEAAGGPVINLASQEYFKAVVPKKLAQPLIHIDFKEKQAGKLKIIGLFAKQARGVMADYMIKNQITKPKDLQAFGERGYQFQPKLSTPDRFIFTR